MNVAANPLCRLAPRTRSQSCAHSIPTTIQSRPNRLVATPNQRQSSLQLAPAIFSTRGDGEGLKEYLLKQETAFNIHNPQPTITASRWVMRLRLPSRVYKIESASRKQIAPDNQSFSATRFRSWIATID